MKILFVDDTVDTRSLFSMVFNQQGHSTRLAADGLEAVEAVRDEPFDAIVMDVDMPRLNGWEATRRIRQTPNGCSVPILMFTHYQGENDSRRAVEVGATGLLRKPLLPQMLLSHLATGDFVAGLEQRDGAAGPDRITAFVQGEVNVLLERTRAEERKRAARQRPWSG